MHLELLSNESAEWHQRLGSQTLSPCLGTYPDCTALAGRVYAISAARRCLSCTVLASCASKGHISKGHIASCFMLSCWTRELKLLQQALQTCKRARAYDSAGKLQLTPCLPDHVILQHALIPATEFDSVPCAFVQIAAALRERRCSAALASTPKC